MADTPKFNIGFQPWPVSPDAQKQEFPPGMFHVLSPESDRAAVFWYDSNVCAELVPWMDIAKPYEGLTLSVFLNEDAIVERLAGALSSIRTEEPEVLPVGDVLVHNLGDGSSVIHACIGDAMLRLVQIENVCTVDDDAIADDDAEFHERTVGKVFNVLTALNSGPRWWTYGGRLLVGEDLLVYTPDVQASKFHVPLTGDDIPEVIRSLVPMLWNAGEPIEAKRYKGLLLTGGCPEGECTCS
ncbi:hypothetical protein ACFPGO_03335 [Arcanobacterium canis]|uniref:Uncharacterized protein n=1 Tax=Arcanobacterium canis TaxID=999183 RepID=A0ABY8G286_9ACTO|nr:hypothetical protein [Arcanobacterium canis]WFM83009.1 hypothetical protein P7079_06320 [Arcanobacterium canis]